MNKTNKDWKVTKRNFTPSLMPHYLLTFRNNMQVDWFSISIGQKPQMTKEPDSLKGCINRWLSLTRLHCLIDVSNINVLPIDEITKQTKKLTVKSQVLYKGELIPMNFSFGLFKDGWRFYDVRIEGVSYIKNYRNQFDAEITATGIDAVIKRLESAG